MADQAAAVQAKTTTNAPSPSSGRASLRTCSCGRHLTPGGGECEACRRARRPTLQRAAHSAASSAGIPPLVADVLRAPGRPLDPRTRGAMETQLGHDFSHVRVHADEPAAESARAVGARAYTVGRDVVFGREGYAPDSSAGRRLLAHELAHVVQQDGSPRIGAESPAAAHEREAERAGDAVAGGGTARPALRALRGLQSAGDPFIKKITVHLTPPETADLEWDGTPPASATGKDHFTVSTGKGYMDPDDPRGTCSRKCCTDPNKQCAPPWNEPGRIGACCTYVGKGFWTGTPEPVHGGPGGWKFWTPIQPHYANRTIALHEYHTSTGEPNNGVNGQPIGHGCVRMEEDNAHRIAEFSRGRRTSVEIEGVAAPVLCTDDRRCGATGSLEGGPGETRLAEAEERAVPGLEGEMG